MRFDITITGGASDCWYRDYIGQTFEAIEASTNALGAKVGDYYVMNPPANTNHYSQLHDA